MKERVLNKYAIYIIATIASLLLAWITFLYKQPFDVDGIWYLNSAQLFLQKGLQASISIYKWPFYSILIASIAKISHLSVLNSAYSLNAILDSFTTIVFVALIKKLGGTKKTQLLGAFLLLSFPYFNHLRIHILRGHGYYPFALLSIVLLMKFAENQRWRYAIGWSLAAICSTLFRIEGIVIFCLLPLALFFYPRTSVKKKFLSCIKSYSLQICIGFTLLLLIIIPLPITHKIIHFGRIPEIIHNIHNILSTILQTTLTKTAIIKSSIISNLNPIIREPIYLLQGGLFALMLGVFIETFGILYFILLLYSLKQKLIETTSYIKSIWAFAIGLNILILSLFLWQNYFLSGRYLGLLSLLLLATIPFAIQHVYNNWRQKKSTLTGSRWCLPVLLVWLSYICISGLWHFGPSKTYIINTGEWIANNTASSELVCSNDLQLSYYTQRKGLIDGKISTLIQPANTQKCQYLVIKLQKHADKTTKEQIAKLPYKKLQEFHNSRGDQALIFRIEKQP